MSCLLGGFRKGSGGGGQVSVKYYSKTVLGCKENRRYEMGVQKIVLRGRRLRKQIF